MKKIYIVLTIALIGIITSCSDSFLEKKPTSAITSDDLQYVIGQRPEMLESMISGMYSLMFSSKTGGLGGHEDFGQKAVDINTDMASADMAMTKNSYGKFYTSETLDALKSTSTLHTYRIWRYYYRIIKATNEIIAAAGGEDLDKIPSKSHHGWGQAKALRAFCYSRLALIYSKGWEHKENNAVSIYLSSDLGKAKGLSTLEDVMNLSKNDLIAAIKALEGFKRESKVQINQDVAKGLLANVAINMDDFEIAIKYSQELIDKYGSKLMTADELYNSGFRSVEINGWLWGVDITSENSTGIASFFAMIDPFTYGYGAFDVKAMDLNLYNKLNNNDIRKYQFSSKSQMNLHKFWDEGRQVDGDKKWEHDYCWMRVAEMYLINAEAKVRGGNPSDAKIVIENFIKTRGAKGIIDGITDAPTYDMSDVKEAVYNQWRIEMWGEGHSYFVLKRFRETSRRGENHMHKPNTEYAFDADEITFQIPENEKLNNPFL